MNVNTGRCSHAERYSGASPSALFAVSSLGLGHATRSLVLIHAFLAEGYRVTVISTGNALAFMRLELADHPAVEWQDWSDYPPLERGTGWRFYAYLALDLFTTWRRIREEHRRFQSIACDYDFVFSDGRYGMYSRWVPSFILSHQIAFIPPKGLQEVSWLSDHLNVAALKKFDCIFIPDYPCPSLNLTGNLSHTAVLQHTRREYVGIMSSYPHQEQEQERDIDYLFVISGYLHEHKGAFVRDLLVQAKNLPGKKVFVLGDAEADPAQYRDAVSELLEVYPLATGPLRQSLFARAQCVVSRAGYTTVMDLVEHDKRALLIPTPNQTEQEYLGYYLDSLNYFVSRDQAKAFDLVAALAETENTRRFDPPWRTQETVHRIQSSMSEALYKHFFSVIVPAHNEESILASTLDCLLTQNYPVDRMEIIIVENGSTDATWAIAERYVMFGDDRLSVRAIQSDLGVSKAKNAGLAAVNVQSEWVIFCDADTHLAPNALRQFNRWINQHGSESLAIGTTRVQPLNTHHWYDHLWFRMYDFVHRMTRSSYSIQLARAPIGRGIGFHPELRFAEDLTFIRECRRYGRFFFIPSDQVATSTRRFEVRGYLKQSLKWLFEALMPLSMKRKRGYDVIR
ncbi:glycosyltransferase [Halothiobacillus sp.]|uniref:glycosyltransferase n=1 Tax=Halothiobacillus sp. TaxID=1891311 RepID=UPI00261B4E9C|nr:glycosyltransferase [Halothiobacillus sp.]